MTLSWCWHPEFWFLGHGRADDWDQDGMPYTFWYVALGPLMVEGKHRRLMEHAA